MQVNDAALPYIPMLFISSKDYSSGSESLLLSSRAEASEVPEDVISGWESKSRPLSRVDRVHVHCPSLHVSQSDHSVHTQT